MFVFTKSATRRTHPNVFRCARWAIVHTHIVDGRVLLFWLSTNHSASSILCRTQVLSKMAPKQKLNDAPTSYFGFPVDAENNTNKTKTGIFFEYKSRFMYKRYRTAYFVFQKHYHNVPRDLSGTISGFSHCLVFRWHAVMSANENQSLNNANNWFDVRSSAIIDHRRSSIIIR